MSESRLVRVEWHDSAHPARLHTTRVRLTEGYSDESHIPRIIAIRFLGGVHDADRVVVEHIEQLGEVA